MRRKNCSSLFLKPRREELALITFGRLTVLLLVTSGIHIRCEMNVFDMQGNAALGDAGWRPQGALFPCLHNKTRFWTNWLPLLLQKKVFVTAVDAIIAGTAPRQTLHFYHGALSSTDGSL